MLFVVLVAIALLVLDAPLTRQLGRLVGVPTTDVPHGQLHAAVVALRWVDVALVLLVMRGFAWIEHVPMGAYGLPWRASAARHLGVGMVLGIGAVTLVIVCFVFTRTMTLSGPLLSPSDMLSAGAQWGMALLAVAFLEELLFRGYLLTTLARGAGFWPAATLLSVLFVAAHLRNPGETAPGLFAVFLFGMVFCASVRVSGALWLAIGIHAGWDWAQSFLFGVPDSGTVARRRLFAPVFGGPASASGGTAGPEGSALTLGLLLIALAMLVRRSSSRSRIANAPVG